MKTCTKCGVEKPLNCFSNLKKSKDKKQYRCKDCQTTERKTRYQEEKEECKVRQKKDRLRPEIRASHLWLGARKRSEKRNGIITIDKKWIEQKIRLGKCELTGISFQLDSSKKFHKNPYGPSLDRINTENPDYSPENSRLVLLCVNESLNQYGLDFMKPIFKILGDLK